MKYRGVDYYPEAWAEERWNEDIRLMKEAKINLVKIGVFAWGKLEPEEGVFELDWFKRISELIANAKINLLIATPTAAPPAWLTSNYPKILNRDEHGKRLPHGLRRHYCPSSPLYIKYSSRVTEKLAELLQDNLAVVGWQIDNEISIGETGPCYCSGCTNLFRKWLKKRYKSLTNLNIAWNTVFWGGQFSAWEEIQPLYPQASWQLDYIKFQSQLFSDFIKKQIDVIRKFDKRSIISTNAWAGLNAPIDATEIFSHLDVASYDCYINYHGTLQAYQATMDLYRNIKYKPATFWIAETGAWNCVTTETNSLKAIRAWFYEFLARGADAVIYFRWRQSIMGEEDHSAILSWSGKPNSRYKNIKNILNEYESLENELTNLPLPETQVAILWSSTTALLKKIKKQLYMEHVIIADSMLNKMGITPDIIPVSEKMDLTKYKLIILPQLEIVDEKIAVKITDFVRNGGKVLSQPRLSLIDTNGKYLTELSPVFLTELFGIKIDERYDISGTPMYGPVQYTIKKERKKNQKVKISCFFENIKAYGMVNMEAPDIDAGVDIVAKYSSGIFKGKPAIVKKKYGKGDSIYQACWMDDLSTEALFKFALNLARIPFYENKIKDITTIKRGQIYFYINHSNKNVKIDNVISGKNLLGSIPKNNKLSIEPYGVCIIKNEN